LGKAHSIQAPIIGVGIKCHNHNVLIKANGRNDFDILGEIDVHDFIFYCEAAALHVMRGTNPQKSIDQGPERGSDKSPRLASFCCFLPNDESETGGSEAINAHLEMNTASHP